MIFITPKHDTNADGATHPADVWEIHKDLSDAIGPIAATYAPFARGSVWNLSSIYLTPSSGASVHALTLM
jgi:hypothetical protein